MDKESSSWVRMWTELRKMMGEVELLQANYPGLMGNVSDLLDRVDQIENGRVLLDALSIQITDNGEKLDDLASRLARAEVAINQVQVPSQPGPPNQQQPNQNGQPSGLTRKITEENDEGVRETLIQLALRDHAKSLQSNPAGPSSDQTNHQFGPSRQGPEGGRANQPLPPGQQPGGGGAQTNISGQFNLFGQPQQPAGEASFVTTSHEPMALPEMTGPAVNEQAVIGMYCPGLTPHHTMVRAFAKVVDYRAHRLKNTSAVVTPKQSERLRKAAKSVNNTTLAATFDGSNPIELLGFLRKLVGSFNLANVSEGEAALMLPWHLKEAPHDVVMQKQQEAGRQVVPYAATWPYLVHALITRFLDDQTLRQAFDAVANQPQRPEEDENAYCDRIQNAATSCFNVFSDAEVVQYFVQGLVPVIRGPVSERLREKSLLEQQDISTARRIAVTEGKTHRLRLEEFANTVKASTPRTVRTRAPAEKVTPVLLTGERTPSTDYTFTAPPTVAPAQTPWDPAMSTDLRPPTNMVPLRVGNEDTYTDLVRQMNGGFSREDRDLNLGEPNAVVRQLFPILSISGLASPTTTSGTSTPTTTDDLMGSLSQRSLEGRPINRSTAEVPTITPEQLQKALSVIPTDYWSLNCWTCREEGHTTFTCPFLTWAQRLYFAYRYYLHQIQANPQMATYLAQREEAREKGESTPQRPGSPRRPPQGNMRPGDGRPRTDRDWLRPNSPGRFRQQRRVNFVQQSVAENEAAPTGGNSTSSSSSNSEEKE